MLATAKKSRITTCECGNTVTTFRVPLKATKTSEHSSNRRSPAGIFGRTVALQQAACPVPIPPALSAAATLQCQHPHTGHPLLPPTAAAAAATAALSAGFVGGSEAPAAAHLGHCMEMHSDAAGAKTQRQGAEKVPVILLQMQQSKHGCQSSCW